MKEILIPFIYFVPQPMLSETAVKLGLATRATVFYLFVLDERTKAEISYNYTDMFVWIGIALY